MHYQFLEAPVNLHLEWDSTSTSSIKRGNFDSFKVFQRERNQYTCKERSRDTVAQAAQRLMRIVLFLE